MIRQVLSVSAAFVGLIAMPTAPQAAADADQTVQLSGGQVQCVVSANLVARGGGPMVVCQRADLVAWGKAPWATSKYNERANLAVVRGTGEFHWDKGTIGVPGGDGISLVPGQTYQINGWTIQPDEHRTRFTYDATGHGLLINPEQARQF